MMQINGKKMGRMNIIITERKMMMKVMKKMETMRMNKMMN